MARRLFEEWFIKFQFPGRESATFNASSQPDGWIPGRLRDILDLKKENTKPGFHLASRQYLPIDCIRPRTLYIIEALGNERAQSSLQLFDENDIIFGAMRPYFHKVTVAPFDGVTRSTCFVLRVKKSKQLGYSAFLMFHENTIAYAAAHSKGATIPYATWEDSLADMPVLLPPISLVEHFSEIVEPTIKFIQTMFFTQATLRSARDLLLPKLISGEIDLSGAEREVERVAAE
jgi:type I restriction enzyme S subunit